MKILQLLEQIQSIHNKYQSKNNFDAMKAIAMRHKHDPEYDNPNSGGFGRVYPSGDPHIINKINYAAAVASKDGYMIYVKFLIDNNIASSNPFAPRVYVMDEIVDKNSESKYRVKMETLHKLSSVEKELLNAIADQLFEPHQLHKLAYVPIADVLARAISSVAKGKISSKNDKLNELCDAIRNIGNDSDVSIDIHSDNIMIRYGKTPQVVIVDPLS